MLKILKLWKNKLMFSTCKTSEFHTLCKKYNICNLPNTRQAIQYSSTNLPIRFWQAHLAMLIHRSHKLLRTRVMQPQELKFLCLIPEQSFCQFFCIQMHSIKQISFRMLDTTEVSRNVFGFDPPISGNKARGAAKDRNSRSLPKNFGRELQKLSWTREVNNLLQFTILGPTNLFLFARLNGATTPLESNTTMAAIHLKHCMWSFSLHQSAIAERGSKRQMVSFLSLRWGWKDNKSSLLEWEVRVLWHCTSHPDVYQVQITK